MFAGKPIIGIAGGIGSGKSFVAKLFGESGCLIIDSDELVRSAYEQSRVKQTLRSWWGDEIFNSLGQVSKKAIADRIFHDPEQRRRLEQFLHPLVAQEREKLMHAVAQDSQIRAFVWDTPLLFETGLYYQCDAVVFVDAPAELRLSRVRQSRNWDAAELAKRENLQWPLDKKQEISDYNIVNAADVDEVRRQVRNILSQICAE